jgi:hypothetical protein
MVQGLGFRKHQQAVHEVIVVEETQIVPKTKMDNYVFTRAALSAPQSISSPLMRLPLWKKRMRGTQASTWSSGTVFLYIF